MNLILVVLVFAVGVAQAQQLVFDTEPALGIEVLRSKLELPDLFDRSRRFFEFGLNFGGIHSHSGNTVYGTSLLDQNFYLHDVSSSDDNPSRVILDQLNSQINTRQTVDVLGLPTGLYYLQILDENGLLASTRFLVYH